jgi:hypothetical protein
MPWPRPDEGESPAANPRFHSGVCDNRGILLDLLPAASYVAATIALFVSFEVRTIDTL